MAATLHISSARLWRKRMSHRLVCLLVVTSLFISGSARTDEPTRPIRIGMIGLDTTHVIGFTRILNDPHATRDLAGVKVVAGYSGGSQDFPASRDRVKGFTEQLRAMGVEIV